MATAAYRITGTKIFISAGEHDLTENIIHLVLARLPDAPKGREGHQPVPRAEIPGQGGRHARRRATASPAARIEHKMGIKASATCVMNFDDATGWLVGEPHKGMRAMFTMMNAERLVGRHPGPRPRARPPIRAPSPMPASACRAARCPAPKHPDKPADPLHRASRHPAHAADHARLYRGLPRARRSGWRRAWTSPSAIADPAERARGRGFHRR